MKEYLQFWNLQKPAFTESVDEKSLFISAGTLMILKRLEILCMQRSGLIAITAPCGHGKTTLAKRLYRNLSIEEVEIIYLSVHKEGIEHWLFARLADYYGISEKLSGQSFNAICGEVLGQIDEISREGKHLLIIIDEADNLTKPASFNEIHSLISMQSATKHCLSFILCGTKRLMDSIYSYPPIKNRLVFKADIEPLTASECRQYLEFRMKSSGLDPNVITHEAINAIHAHSQGIFSVINAIVENCLIECYVTDRRTIGVDIVKSAINYIKSDRYSESKATPMLVAVGKGQGGVVEEMEPSRQLEGKKEPALEPHILRVPQMPPEIPLVDHTSEDVGEDSGDAKELEKDEKIEDAGADAKSLTADQKTKRDDSELGQNKLDPKAKKDTEDTKKTTPIRLSSLFYKGGDDKAS